MIAKQTISFDETAVLLIDLNTVKAHLNIIRTDEDSLLTAYLENALDWASTELGYNVRKSTVDYYFDRDETDNTGERIAIRGGLRIPAHVQSLTGVYFHGTSGEQLMVQNTDYTFNRSGQYIPIVKILQTPESFADTGHGYRVRVVEGFSNAATNQHDKLPPAIKQAVLMKVRDIYDFRGQEIVGTISSQLSVIAADYLRPYSKIMIQ